MNCVLIANVELLSSYAASEYVGPVVDEDAAGPVRRRIDGNLHLDTAARSQDLHALIRDHLCAARKHGLAGGKIEHRGSQPVDSHLWIALDQAQRARRFVLEQEAREMNRITADVH